MPDFGWYGYTPSGVYGARDFTLTQIIRTHRSQTCDVNKNLVAKIRGETHGYGSEYWLGRARI